MEISLCVNISLTMVTGLTCICCVTQGVLHHGAGGGHHPALSAVLVVDDALVLLQLLIAHHVEGVLSVRGLVYGGVVLEVPLDDALAGGAHLHIAAAVNVRHLVLVHLLRLLPAEAVQHLGLGPGVDPALPPALFHQLLDSFELFRV